MPRRARLRSTGLVAVLVLVVVGLAGCDWTQPRFDPARTANNPVSGLSTSNASTLREAWSATGAGPSVGGSSAVLVAGGIVLAQNLPGGTVAFRASDGQFRWVATPAVGAIDHTMVYGLTRPAPDGSAYTLHAMALDSGTDQWSATQRAGGGGALSCDFCGDSVLAAADGTVYVLTAFNSAHGATPERGVDVWDTASRRIVHSFSGIDSQNTPAIVNGVLYYRALTYPSLQIVAVEARTGKQLWAQPTLGNCFTADTAVANGYVFLGGTTYRAKDGTVISPWRGCVEGEFAVAGTTIFGLRPSPTHTAYELVSFDGVTGAAHWSYNVASEQLQTPTISNNVVWVANSVAVIGFDIGTGRPVTLLGNFDNFPFAPVVVDGTVYVATTDKIYAFRPG